jgi:hypothetical protein
VEAENKRMREALDRIASSDHTDLINDNEYFDIKVSLARIYEEIAEQALKEVR